MNTNPKNIDIALDEPVEQTEIAQPEEKPAEVKETSAPKRRRRRIGPALLGFAQSVLSIVGVVAIIWAAISGIIKLTDTSHLHEEMYYFLEPVLVYTPDEFKNSTLNEQDAFLNAAAYRVMQAEQIRMMREKDETPIYPVDDNGRIAVETKEVEKSYRALFGSLAVITNRSIEESNLEYSQEDGCYYIPFETLNTGSRPIVMSVKRTWIGYKVRVGYVPVTDIQLDEHGNEIMPTEDMATHFQTYTVRKIGKRYAIQSCVNK